MNIDPDQYLHRLVVAALTVFVVVSLLLGAFVAREIWLQQQIVGLSSSLQVSLEELEETTEEIQSKMSEMDASAQSTPAAQEWDSVNELLEDVDQQLVAIDENIDEVAVVSEEQIDITTAADSVEDKPTGSLRAQADQVFTIFSVLTGIAAIAIAILLGMAMRVQDNRLTV